mmetsp:Transcript_42439/g.127212  ORF Transcript_42439/g.127212 Transcript_42439/m.127212 type:complete len:274 (-) Transcript_42439:276-1097(-)
MAKRLRHCVGSRPAIEVCDHAAVCARHQHRQTHTCVARERRGTHLKLSMQHSADSAVAHEDFVVQECRAPRRHARLGQTPSAVGADRAEHRRASRQHRRQPLRERLCVNEMWGAEEQRGRRRRRCSRSGGVSEVAHPAWRTNSGVTCPALHARPHNARPRAIAERRQVAAAGDKGVHLGAGKVRRPQRHPRAVVPVHHWAVAHSLQHATNHSWLDAIVRLKALSHPLRDVADFDAPAAAALGQQQAQRRRLAATQLARHRGGHVGRSAARVAL